MNTLNAANDWFANLTVGEVIAWGAAIAGIIGGVVTITIRLYKVFGKYRDMQEEKESLYKRLDNFDQTQKKIVEKIDEMQTSINNQSEINYKQLKFFIVQGCTEAIRDGFITAERLKALEEMFDEYQTVYHGNGYVKTLMIKVRGLSIKQ